MPGNVEEALQRFMEQRGQPQQIQAQQVIIGQRQPQQHGNNPCQELTVQRANADYERMVEDQRYINEIKRMQETQMRWRMTKLTKRRKNSI